MIKSRVLNLIVIAFGATLCAFAFAGVYDQVRHRPDGGGLTIALLFLGFGVWCVLGGAHNLRSLRTGVATPLRTADRFAQWNAIAILAFLALAIGSAIVVGWFGGGRGFEFLSALGACGLLISFLTASGVLVVRFLSRVR